LLKVVRESQASGKVFGSLNSNFLALIPKNEYETSFDNYRSISSCNVIYNLVEKVIAIRLNPIFSEVISVEQFGFLQNRKIHDAISLA
jgi:hypothetical protein